VLAYLRYKNENEVLSRPVPRNEAASQHCPHALRTITVTTGFALLSLLAPPDASADNEALQLELGRELKQDMSRSAAPFTAVSTTVEYLSNLQLAYETARKLDNMERSLATKLPSSTSPGVGNCALIRVNAWNNIISGQTKVGDPIFYGFSSNPVNLLVQQEVMRAIRGVVEARPSGREWAFDGNKAFFMCYTKTTDGKYRRGLVAYQTAINLIDDKGQELIRNAPDRSWRDCACGMIGLTTRCS
jgi:hypothetical protein